MIIGLDWDGTVTNAPGLFLNFAETAKSQGHKVYIVTMRYPSEDLGLDDAWHNAIEGVVYTSREAKLPTFKAVYGFVPHVWIDDNPRAVNESAAQVFGWTSPEGKVIDPKH